ncbi:MAG: sulfite exporter TauE/SafE family protein [Pseudomonadota bacterium]
MIDVTLLLLGTGVFLLAGMVKGVIGLGLPTVSLGLMTLVLDLPSAMALMAAPSLVTNLWQASVGGHTREVFLRIWPFLAVATATVWIGAQGLNTFDLNWLTMLLGLLLVTYAGLNIAGVRITIDRAGEPWAAPCFGLANGMLTGLTGSFVVPGVMFLQAIGLPREQLVQAMGMLFTLSTLAVAATLGTQGMWTVELGWMSLAAIIPAIYGMILGTWARKRLSEAMFRRLFFYALLALGLWIVIRSLVT